MRLQVGDIVQHFKGGIYEIISLDALHTETEEQLAVYKSCETGKVFCRPLEMFLGKVDKEKYPNATQGYRLELIRRP